MTHPIARALRRLRAWRESRYWSPRRQLEHLRGLVDLDAHILAPDRTAAALTARYADALAPDWFRRPFENSGALRDRLGLNLWRRAADSKAGSISAADIERLRKELQDAADAAVTASNQAVRYLRERDAARTDLQRETRRADYLRRQLDTIAEQNAELRRAAGTAPSVDIPAGLHPRTADLVLRFASALAHKLHAAEQKYGYSDGWAQPDWMDECRAALVEHVRKGDPRDVGAYCAFLWHHGERTALPEPTLEDVRDAAHETGWLIECKQSPSWWSGKVMRGTVDCRFFSTDPNEAVRFARKKDAERVIAQAGTSCQHATEHAWISAMQQEQAK